MQSYSPVKPQQYLPFKPKSASKLRILASLLLVCLLLSSCLIDTRPVKAPSAGLEGITTYSGPRATIPQGRFFYESNMWGINPDLPYDQYLISREIDGRTEYGWTWCWVGTAKNTVFAYPEIILGWKPWDQHTSTDPDFPIAIEDVESLRMQYDISLEASGVYNLAPEIWLLREKPAQIPCEKPEFYISAEIMIWSDHTSGLKPAGKRVAVATVAGIDYELYALAGHKNSNSEAAWGIYTYIATKPLHKADIDLLAFLQDLKGRGYDISPKQWIASVEFGTELFGKSFFGRTEGTVWVHSYDVQLTKTKDNTL